MRVYQWVLILALLYLLAWLPRRRRTMAAAYMKRRKKGNSGMEEMAKQFIGKECILYTLTDASGALQGVIRAVENGGILVEDRMGQLQAVNLEYVTRIREYPRNKKGKKKPVVVD